MQQPLFYQESLISLASGGFVRTLSSHSCPPGANFFEKKFDQKTLHRFFQGFPSALERGLESLCSPNLWLLKGHQFTLMR
jgi:hypothetical protein